MESTKEGVPSPAKLLDAVHALWVQAADVLTAYRGVGTHMEPCQLHMQVPTPICAAGTLKSWTPCWQVMPLATSVGQDPDIHGDEAGVGLGVELRGA